MDVSGGEPLLLHAGRAAAERRDTPKLNGSSTAFVALLIVLTLIIITACSAAIYLLWENSNNRDRQARVRRYKSSGIEAAAADSSWMARLTALFGSRNMGRSHDCSKPPKKQAIKGWLQSVDRETKRDPLATIEEQPEEHLKDDAARVYPQMVQASRPSFSTTASGSSPGSVYDHTRPPLQFARPPLAMHRAASLASTTSNRSMSVSFVGHPAPRAQGSIPSIAETMSSTSHPHTPILLPPPLEHGELVYPNGRGRPFATRSGTSMTLEGGTKFMEEL